MDRESGKDLTKGLDDCNTGFVSVVAALGNGVHRTGTYALLRQRLYFFRAKSQTEGRCLMLFY